MTDEEFSDYAHEAVHELIEANEKYHQQFKIGEYERWFYDLEKGTLTFSHHGVAQVVAAIQAIGSLSTQTGTWLWGWANESIPKEMCKAMLAVRDFGQKHNISRLTEDYWEATEDDGWEMSAVTARLLGAKGVYRCPGESGFIFLLLTYIYFVQ